MQAEQIRWMPIPNHSRYEVSELGGIRSNNYKNSGNTKELKPAKSPDGYMKTMLQKDDGGYTTITVHKAIWMGFNQSTDGLEINHINGIKDDNRLCNLELVTRLENMQHASKLGLLNAMVGSKNGMAKLTEAQVKEIRDVAANSGRYYGRKELATKYGVSECTIKEVVTRRKNKFYNVH